jgi:hypothetical protein
MTGRGPASTGQPSAEGRRDCMKWFTRPSRGCRSCSGRRARLNNGDPERRQLRAMRFLARHPGGCTEATLLNQGFTAVQLGPLVYAGLASYEEQAARRCSG